MKCGESKGPGLSGTGLVKLSLKQIVVLTLLKGERTARAIIDRHDDRPKTEKITGFG
jgi:hypothetical protein